jgi:diphosphomevalonate decarboxylase
VTNPSTATAVAHPNIAFIKYWGNRDDDLRLPANSSLSMNLAGLETRTTVAFDSSLKGDQLELNSQLASSPQLARVSQFLDLVRQMSGLTASARVHSENNFPSGAGVASSSSAFAALALASSTAAGLKLDKAKLSRLARRGSGSASRSVPGGFVEWRAADRDEESYAFSIASADHWAIVDCIAVVSETHKEVGSSVGHQLAGSSPLQAGRLLGAEARLERCRAAILQKDFVAMAEVVELESHLMHAVMMTSRPPLIYWQPASLAIMQAVREWRAAGLGACYTLDAGPNAHVICLAQDAKQIAKQIAAIPGVTRVLEAGPGGPASLVTNFLASS